MSRMNMGSVMTKQDHARQKRLQSFKDALRGYLFLLPWMLGIVMFVAYPLIYSFFISFQKVGVKNDGSGLKYDFVGMDNYKHAFVVDNVFPVEMFLFMREVMLVVPITVLFALLISILLNQKFKGRMLFRAVFFLARYFRFRAGAARTVQSRAGHIASCGEIQPGGCDLRCTADNRCRNRYGLIGQVRHYSLVLRRADHFVFGGIPDHPQNDLRSSADRRGDAMGILLEDYVSRHFSVYYFESHLYVGGAVFQPV